MIAAETALDLFWRAANAHWVRYVGTTPTALVKHIIGVQDASLGRASEQTAHVHFALRRACDDASVLRTQSRR
jgi:hypothetical protein